MTSLLNFIIVISGVILALFALDAYRRGKMNLLHFLVFGGGGMVVVIFIFKPYLLVEFANVFGITQWGMLIAYLAIIFLAYMSLQMLHKITKDNYDFGRLITSLTINNIYISSKVIYEIAQKPIYIHDTNIPKWKFMFMVKWYNEEKMIGNVIDEIINDGYSKILIINDWSTDDTQSIVDSKIEQYPDKLILQIIHPINRKHGWGNKTWIEFFRKYGDILDINWVVFFDSDGQMDIKDMSIFAKYIYQNPNIDIIQWSRFVNGGEAKNIPVFRKIILWWARLITYMFSGKLVTDSHNGYKCFTLKAIQKIQIYTDTTSYANELIDEYTRLWLNYAEVPVHIRYTQYSMSWRWQSNGNAINILIELIYKKLFFR